MKLNFEEFERDLCDLVIEGQLKLGYEYAAARFNFPLESIARTYGCTPENIKSELSEFCAFSQSRLGEISIAYNSTMAAILIPADGVKYIHENVAPDAFLYEFIECVRKPFCKTDDIVQTFKKYSDRVIIEKPPTDEFDALIYFDENDRRGRYRYCVKIEDEFATYHRLTKYDYDNLYGGAEN